MVKVSWKHLSFNLREKTTTTKQNNYSQILETLLSWRKVPLDPSLLFALLPMFMSGDTHFLCRVWQPTLLITTVCLCVCYSTTLNWNLLLLPLSHFFSFFLYCCVRINRFYSFMPHQHCLLSFSYDTVSPHCFNFLISNAIAAVPTWKGPCED